MLYTVSLAVPSPSMRWQANLLEYSWKKVGQEGLLVQLMIKDHGQEAEIAPPRHAHRLQIGTPPFDAVSRDQPWALAASLFEWLCRDRPEGTVLVLPAHCIFRRTVTRHVAPGLVAAQPWPHSGLRKPATGYPFGFPPGFSFLSECCLRVDVQPTSVTLPLLIHSDDLRRIAPRWLQLCRLIADTCRDAAGQPIAAASEYAFLAAASEFGLVADADPLLASVAVPESVASHEAMIGYAEPVLAHTGGQIFNKETFVPWSFLPEHPTPQSTAGHDFITTLNACADAERIASGLFALHRVPRWRAGVMEGRVKDDILLEIPEKQQSLWLNASGKEVWELCDGSLNVDDIRSELVRRYPRAEAVVPGEVLAMIDALSSLGFLDGR